MSDSPRIRVLVAEDNEVMRLGTVTLLRMQPDLEVVGEAADGAQAIEMFRALRPDVLVLDLRMPVMDGVQVTSALCGEPEGARILVVTHYDGEEDVFRAVNSGARGYVTKDARGEVILEAIRTVHAGRRYLPPEILDRLTTRISQPALTVREQQVLEGIFKGLSNREIAEELSLSEKTAGTYVTALLRKLDAKSRTEAVAIALRRGLLPR